MMQNERYADVEIKGVAAVMDGSKTVMFVLKITGENGSHLRPIFPQTLTEVRNFRCWLVESQGAFWGGVREMDKLIQQILRECRPVDLDRMCSDNSLGNSKTALVTET